MSIKNRMGGVVSAWFIPIYDIAEYFRINSREVCYKISADRTPHKLAFPSEGFQLNSEYDDEIYTISAEIKLISDKLSTDDEILLRSSTEGFVIIYKQSDEVLRIVGSPVTPLKGHLASPSGTKVSDANHFTLSLSCESEIDAMKAIEL